MAQVASAGWALLSLSFDVGLAWKPNYVYWFFYFQYLENMSSCLGTHFIWKWKWRSTLGSILLYYNIILENTSKREVEKTWYSRREVEKREKNNLYDLDWCTKMRWEDGRGGCTSGVTSVNWQHTMTTTVPQHMENQASHKLHHDNNTSPSTGTSCTTECTNSTMTTTTA